MEVAGPDPRAWVWGAGVSENWCLSSSGEDVCPVVVWGALVILPGQLRSWI